MEEIEKFLVGLMSFYFIVAVVFIAIAISSIADIVKFFRKGKGKPDKNPPPKKEWITEYDVLKEDFEKKKRLKEEAKKNNDINGYK